MSAVAQSSPHSEASAIIPSEAKSVELPIWGIAVPPVAEDWIKAGFRVSFTIDPATVNTWMVTREGLVTVDLGGNASSRQQNPIQINVNTTEELLRAETLSVEGLSGSASAANSPPHVHNRFSASEASSTIVGDRDSDYDGNTVTNSHMHLIPSPSSTNTYFQLPSAPPTTLTTQVRATTRRPRPPPLHLTHSNYDTFWRYKYTDNRIAGASVTTSIPSTPRNVSWSASTITVATRGPVSPIFNNRGSAELSTRTNVFPLPARTVTRTNHNNCAGDNCGGNFDNIYANHSLTELVSAYNAGPQVIPPAWFNRWTLEPEPPIFPQWPTGREEFFRGLERTCLDGIQ